MNRNRENANATGDTINRRLHTTYERYLAEPERRPEDAGDDLADDYDDVQRRIIEEHRLEEEEIGRHDDADYCNCRRCIDDDCDPDEREEP